MPKSSAPFLALSCVGFIVSAPAAADPIPSADKPIPAEQQQGRAQAGNRANAERDDIIVTGDQIQPVELESPKATRAVIDTPQTITVVGDQTIRQQNLVTLRDVLQTLPGITFGAGEGGGGYGDSINLRGYSASNDITIDGVRDSAQYSRTETFNLQQVEVYNGANSVFSGAGSVGGTINLVTKRPQARDLTVVSGGIGTDDYYRTTIDSNVRAGDLIGLRLNAVAHRNDYPGRNVERNTRWAVAPSATIGMAGPTQLTLQYVHQEDQNTPVFGVPYFRNAVNGGLPPGADPARYYGIRNLDRQDITFDQATATMSHVVNDRLSVRFLNRWQRVRQDSRTSAPQGVFCLRTGFQPLPATNVATTPLACPVGQNVPDTYYPSGPRGFVRDQENQLLYNQTDIRGVVDTAGLEHTLVVGASFGLEDYSIVSGNLLRTATGATVAQPPLGLVDPDTTYRGPVNFIRSGHSDGETSNVAVYAFDTVRIVDRLELSGGARWESARAEFRADTFNVIPGATLGAYTRGAVQRSDERLFSYRAGLNFKPTEQTSLYASIGDSKTPTSTTVRLGCGTPLQGSDGVLRDPCDVAPETARNYEVGAKAGLMGGRLQLTAALFRNERTNYRVATNDPIVQTLQVADGRSRVDGIALGATGAITRNWSIFANYTYLDGHVLQSVSDFCLANPGPRRQGAATVNPCANSADIRDPQAGTRLTNTPEHSGSLFTTYTLPFGLQLGYGLTYTGSFALNNPALATPLAPTATLTPVFHSEDWLTHRAFLSYTVTGGLTAQLNVQNVTDERYYTSIRNNGWAIPGEARSVRFTLFYSY